MIRIGLFCYQTWKSNNMTGINERKRIDWLRCVWYAIESSVPLPKLKLCYIIGVFFMAKQADKYSDNNNRTIAYVRYIKIRTWLRGFRDKIANFSRLYCLTIARRDLSTKKTKPNIEKWRESLGVMVNISDVGYLRSFSNHEGCPIRPNWIRWTKAMNNQTHRKSVRERLSKAR